MNNEELNARYKLICRASHFSSDESPVQNELADELAKLKRIISHELPALARQRSPHNFVELHHNLRIEMERFHDFCEFPYLANKVVVGLGGAFSAGKSSLINGLLGEKRLVTEIDPTTSLPTYLLNGKEETITALNLFKRRVDLTQDEFLTLTHDEMERYGSQISTLLQSVFIRLPNFPFENIALLDTPGYSKPDDMNWSHRTDANLARIQLNSAQFVIWVVSAEAGTIPEEDLRFLSSLRQDIPRLVVISRADKRTPEDINRMVDLIRTTLNNRGLPAVDVLPFSNRKKANYSITPILNCLQKWNAVPRELGFAINFKCQFLSYQKFIEDEQRLSHRRLNKLNRILTISDEQTVHEDAQELKKIAKQDLDQLQQISETLQTLKQRFFQGLKFLGNHQNIPLPEPSDIDLLSVTRLELLELLSDLRQVDDLPEVDASPVWAGLTSNNKPNNLSQVLRQALPPAQSTLSLTQSNLVSNRDKLLGKLPPNNIRLYKF